MLREKVAWVNLWSLYIESTSISFCLYVRSSVFSSLCPFFCVSLLLCFLLPVHSFHFVHSVSRSAWWSFIRPTSILPYVRSSVYSSFCLILLLPPLPSLSPSSGSLSVFLSNWSSFSLSAIQSIHLSICSTCCPSSVRFTLSPFVLVHSIKLSVYMSRNLGITIESPTARDDQVSIKFILHQR